MNFTLEMYKLLIRYTKDIDGRDIAIDEIQQLPHWRCVWGWWLALAHYKMDNFYQRLEDVPEGTEHYRVISGNSMKMYNNLNDGYVQEITKDDCKTWYGERL